MSLTAIQMALDVLSQATSFRTKKARDGHNAAMVALRAALDDLRAELAKPEPPDWKAISRVQSAKLACAITEPGAHERLKAVLRETDLDRPKPQARPTAGMNMVQRILHVSGRTNAAGYVEFGSVQAVEALVQQVLRDIHPGLAAERGPVMPSRYSPDEVSSQPQSPNQATA